MYTLIYGYPYTYIHIHKYLYPRSPRARPIVAPHSWLGDRALVLRHRLVLSYEALADGVQPDDLLAQIVSAVPLPEVPLHERNATRPVANT